MKKNILITVLIAIFALSNAFSQMQSIKRGPKYAFDFDLSPKISAGAASLNNLNIVNDANVTKDPFGLTYAYGGKFGITYISASPRYVFFSIYADYMMNTANQLYTLNDFSSGSAEPYTKTITTKGTQMNYMLRITGFTGKYHESGKYLEFGLRNNVNQVVSEKWNLAALGTTTIPDVKYNPTYKSVVIGLGFFGNYTNIGLRTSFSLDDICIDPYNPVSDGIYSSSNATDYSAAFATYAPTKLFTLELVLEINLYFLEIGTASCGALAMTGFPMFINHEYIW